MFHAIGQFYPDYKREESNNEYFKCMKYGRDYITIRRRRYLLIVWEKEKGIVYYMRGNGAMNMHVEFGVDLKREQLTDYGNPYRMFH